MSTRLFSVFSFLIVAVSYSQDRPIDSLKVILKNPKVHDTTKLASISDVMQMYYTENDRNYYYLNALAGKILDANEHKKVPAEVRKTFTLWRGAYYSTRGVEYLHRPDKANGLPYFDKGIAMFKSVGALDEAYFHTVAKASLYTRMNEYEKAIACIMPALKYFEKDPEYNSDEMSYTLTGLAYIYQQQGKYEKSIKYNKEVLHYQEILNREYPQSEKDYSKAKVYLNIASAYMSLKKYPEAIKYATDALRLSEAIGDTTFKSILLCRIGTAKMKLLQYDEAEKLFNQVLQLEGLTDAVDDVAVINANLGLGELSYTKKDLAKAKHYAAKAFDLSEKAGNLELRKSSTALLYRVSKKSHDYKTALAMYERMDKLADSVKLEASKNTLAQQMMKYGFEKKELELKLKAEREAAVKNNWLIAVSGVVLLLLLGGYFYYRNSRQKQAIALLEKNQIKQKLLVSQMNPHFIFNSISNIQGLIRNEQDADAINYLTKFSSLTRQILENSNENYIALQDEVDMTRNYIAIQQLLYSNAFDYSITVDEDIDTESYFLPPMLTQPFIENAIKHGINGSKSGCIAIRFFLKEGRLFFEVTDNGHGFDASHKQTGHKSMAMAITKDRLVGYTGDKDFVVHTENITGEGETVTGAKVVFEIPYIYEN